MNTLLEIIGWFVLAAIPFVLGFYLGAKAGYKLGLKTAGEIAEKVIDEM